MATNTITVYVIVHQEAPPATARTAPPAQGGRGGRDARDLGDRIRAEVQAEIDAARAQAQATAGVPAPPTPPENPRTFTISGPNGERTVIGMPPPGEIIPPQAVDISIAFFLTMAAIIIGLPIARAFARRMDRKSAPGQVPNEVSAQLAQLNQAVDAIALEVERISEGQRFTTRLLSEQRDQARQTLPSGANR